MAALTLAEQRSSGLAATEAIAGRLGYVHDLFLEFDYELVDRLPAAGDVVAIADNKDPRGKLEQIARHDGRVVVVLAGSDGGFGGELLPGGELPTNVVALLTINNELDDPRAVGVPLGVRVERADLLRRAMHRFRGRREGLLYANFSAGPLYPRRNGIPHIRHRLAEQFGEADWVALQTGDGGRRSDESRLAYYAELARHEFALSPEGFGADCYRHWECLYLGTIPIVQSSPAMSRFSELPILFTEDYGEIDRPYLEAQRERFAGRRFEFEKLRMTHYQELFRERLSKLSSPAFLCWGFRGTDDEPFLERLKRARERVGS